MSASATIACLFLVLTCITFVTDIFDNAKEEEMKKAFGCAGAVVALTLFCMYVIVTLNVSA